MNKKLQKTITHLPLSPGIYFFKDKDGTILYVGKAKKLRNRVRSYFAVSNQLSPSKQMMVQKISSIDTIITSTEQEALILESIHIKKHRPRYNIALKDDKQYRFIKIDYRYARPLVTTVRRPEHDIGRSRARYFGPHTSGADLQETLRFLQRIFPYRKKSKPLSLFEEALLKKRTLGPVPETDQEYADMIGRFIRVLEGHGDDVAADLKKRMQELSTERQFEKAAAVRDQIKALSIMQSRQKMVSAKGESQDVISISQDEQQAAVNVFVIRMGRLLDKLNFILSNVYDAKPTELLDAFLLQYYSETTNVPKELIIPVRTTLTEDELTVIASGATAERSNPFDAADTDLLQDTIRRDNQITASILPPRRNNITITVPHHGTKRDLIKLGEQNARDYLIRTKASWEQDSATTEALEQLTKTLKLNAAPQRIEGYDISNIQGNLSVGSMVVFTDGMPDKNEYRKFKIKTVSGPNDFASLAEVLKRRFSPDNQKNWKQPDLVMLDGGKGQLSTVLSQLPAISCPLSDNHFIALAKREEEVFQGKNLKKVNLNPSSSASHLLQRIRDEAHRFGQAYYHSRHTKANVQSILDEIPGIGPKTRKQLIHRFGSVSGIREATKDDIIELIGKAKADKLIENL